MLSYQQFIRSMATVHQNPGQNKLKLGQQIEQSLLT